MALLAAPRRWWARRETARLASQLRAAVARDQLALDRAAALLAAAQGVAPETYAVLATAHELAVKRLTLHQRLLSTLDREVGA